VINAEKELALAIKWFWETRGQQQGSETAANLPYAGTRAAVVGGRHADGFISLIASIVADAGLPNAEVRYQKRNAGTIPGYFRPCKVWDLVVVCNRDLIAAVEVKSQVGSFGNNFNNRVEEALGNATDFWAAYKKGLFKPSQRPWLGYLFMLQEHVTSIRPTGEINLKPFPVDPAFQGRSYAKRYELVCERLVRERLYDAVCFVMSKAETGKKGAYAQPNAELGIVPFARSLHAHAAAYASVK
jgi:hypothetical protein